MSEVPQQDIYSAMIAELEAKIAIMQNTITNLQSLRGGPPQTISSSFPSSGTPSAPLAHDAFFGMSVADAAKKYLSSIRKTAAVSVICEALVRGGWKTSSKNPVETLRTTLGRTPEFVRINGEFGLTEWYPGRKSARVKRDVGTLEALSGADSQFGNVPITSTDDPETYEAAS